MRMKSDKRKFELSIKKRFLANPTCKCGKSNKDGKFANELDTSGDHIGYCHSCGLNAWKNHDTVLRPNHIKKEDIPVTCTPEMKSLIDHFDAGLKSVFTQFLVKTMGGNMAVKIVEMYYLGVLNNDVIFWQIDTLKSLRAGKVMAYNEAGKRQGFPRWWHRIKGSTCQLNQCFFGEHLISTINKPIAIVESEKTACLMTIFNPAFLWLACGSASNLQDNKCSSISKYDVTLFPDHKQYDENSNWKAKGEKWGFKVSSDCESWFKQGSIPDGGDIADYYLFREKELELRASDIIKQDTGWNYGEYDNIFKTPKNPI